MAPSVKSYLVPLYNTIIVAFQSPPKHVVGYHDLDNIRQDMMGNAMQCTHSAWLVKVHTTWSFWTSAWSDPSPCGSFPPG